MLFPSSTTSRLRAGLLASLAGAALLGSLPVSVEAQSVDVSVSPSTVPLGRTSRLSIRVQDAGQVRASLPSVNGLRFDSIGQESSYNFVNGRASRSNTYYYRVTPLRDGSFTIPSFTVEADSKKLTTTAQHLTVTPGAAPQQPTAPRQRQVIHPRPTPNQILGLPTQQAQQQQIPRPTVPQQPGAQPQPQQAAPGAVPANAGPIFMVMETPMGREVYVGQMVPVTFKIYIQADIMPELRSLPQIDNQAFTVNEMPTVPEQPSERINGQLYRVLIWNTGITPVKAGDYLLQATIDMRVPERRSSRRGGGIFNDPFFSNFGGGRKVDRTFGTEPETWTVMDLPADGQPASFDGAIGQFNIGAKATPDKVEVGEPLTLVTVVQGQGNFNRVTAPQFADDEGIKVYPGKAEVEFTDDSRTNGRKVFEQAVIPKGESMTTLPPLVFSYFDPVTKNYVTRDFDVPGVTITGGSGGTTTASTSAPTTNAEATPPSAPHSDLVPIQVELTGFTKSFAPVYIQPWFIVANSVPLILIAAGFLVHRRREHLANDPSLMAAREHQRAVRTELEAMATALGADQSGPFFTAARRALQQALAKKWGLRPDDISLSVVASRSPELAESVGPVYAMADEAAYSGQVATQVSLAEWDKSVREQIRYIDSKL